MITTMMVGGPSFLLLIGGAVVAAIILGLIIALVLSLKGSDRGKSD